MEGAESKAPDSPQQLTDHTSQQSAPSTSAWPRSSLWPTFGPSVSMRVLSCITLVSLAPSAPLSPALAMLAPKRHLAAAVIPRPLPLLVSNVGPLPELKAVPSSEPLLGLPGACSSASSAGMHEIVPCVGKAADARLAAGPEPAWAKHTSGPSAAHGLAPAGLCFHSTSWARFDQTFRWQWQLRGRHTRPTDHACHLSACVLP